MIDPMLVDEIEGLDKLFEFLPQEYSFHDSELESVNWNAEQCELIAVYSCYSFLPEDEVYYVTFHIKPSMEDFEVFVSPHNPYTFGIDIVRSEDPRYKYIFKADCAGPCVNCDNIWIEIEKADPKEFFKH